MLSWLPAVPYGPAGDGYWGPITTTLDWCEENYYLTPYTAEVVNTATNGFFLYLGVKGIRNCITEGHEPIFAISFCGYLLVGIGSFFFHATLKYPWQLVDELGMIYTTCIMFYATFTHKKSELYASVLGFSLISLCVFITGYYHYLQDPTFHQIAYGILTAGVLFRAMWVMEMDIRHTLLKSDDVSMLNGNLSSNEKTEKRRINDRDTKVLQDMWQMVYYGLGSFLGGFVFWNLDNVFCGQLRSARRGIGLPWGVLLEGHGYWHIMTGIGAYFYLVWGIWLRKCLNHQQDEYELKWEWCGAPSLIKRRTPLLKANGAANGASNGAARKKTL